MNEEKSLTNTHINWFPGHMTRTKRKIAETLKLIDIVVEIVDARVPQSSRNPDFDDLFLNKPRIIILNKCDMADSKKTNEWIDSYKNQKINAIATDCKSGKGLNLFVPMVRAVLKDKMDAAKNKGINKNIRAMIDRKSVV